MAGAGAISLMLGWMLVVVGHTTIVAHSTLFAPLRQRLSFSVFLHTLITCSMCVGWWVGVFWALVGWPLVDLGPSLASRALAVLASGCASSILAWSHHVGFAAINEGPIKIVSAVRGRPKP